jgi:hypothetical protein
MGRDKIDHGPGQKDDLANGASLAMVLAASTPAPMTFAMPPDWSKAAVGYDSGTGTVARNPALANGAEYAGHDFFPHMPTER